MARRITLIAARARNGVIGKDGTMPWHISADLKHFKATTMGHPMIMGRKTWESWGARPLPGRRHIIVSRNLDYQAPGAEVVSSLSQALALVPTEDVFIVGGAQIYREALAYATDAVISEIPLEPEGDTWFPELDNSWSAVRHEQNDGFETVHFEHRSGGVVA
ncbi:MAG: dihydrofolate reductase [Propionibacteriaceae bacterium]